MNIDEILEVIDDMLDKAWALPLSGGKSVVDADRMRDLVDDIRLSMPMEIKQAKAIVADRHDIIESARAEAAEIVRRSEERARAIVSEEEIVKQSQRKAGELMQNAQIKAREVRHAANELADNMLRGAEETLLKNIADVRSARQVLKNQRAK